MKVSIGDEYWSWEVIIPGKIKSLCKCKCGNERYVVNHSLRRGSSKQCIVCSRKETARIKRERLLYVGKEFNCWTVVDPRPVNSLCVCICGLKKLVKNHHLLTGASKQCRLCQTKDRSYGIELGISSDLYTRLRVAVNDAIARCTDPKNEAYQYYGDRGISVFPAWLKDRKSFVRYLITLDGFDNRKLWLDRMDNDGNYEPGNLRFVTPKVSQNNKRQRKSRKLVNV